MAENPLAWVRQGVQDYSLSLMAKGGNGPAIARKALVCCLVLTACRDEIVQTASRSSSPQPAVGGNGGGSGASSVDSLDCVALEPSDALPEGTEFGEGSAFDSWPMVTGDYGAQEGPGLYVVGRDTFRVFHNGHLIGQSAAARYPLFVPLSLLPGENVIAIALTATNGTPAVLAQLDELDRSLVSGTDWRLSVAPEGEWTQPGYDDSDWVAVTDLGAMGSLDGCEPTAGFAEESGAHWIGPELGTEGPVALRKVVDVSPVGFAQGTTGGVEGEPTLVTTWDELETLAASADPMTIVLAEGENDFRRTGSEVESGNVCSAVCSDDPATTVYRAMSSSATCSTTITTVERNERQLYMGSNKTLVGLGRGALLRGVGLDLSGSQNVIVRNVALYDVNPAILEAGDALWTSATSGLWLDHLTVKWVSDSFMDVLGSTDQMTVSWSLFDGGTDGECRGQERWAASFTDSQVTMHHCRFDQVSTHAPLAYGASTQVHLFDNLFSNSLDWTLGASCAAEVRVESCTFENVDVISRLSTCDETGLRGLMNAVDGANLYRDGTPVFVGEDSLEPYDEVFVPEYDYVVEEAAVAWPRVLLRAGAGGPWAFTLAVD